MERLFKPIFLTLIAAFSLATGNVSLAQTPAPSPSASPAAPEIDYSALLKQVMDDGPENFGKKESSTPEEYRDYVNLLTQIIETEALMEERVSSAQSLRSQIAEVKTLIGNFKPQDIKPDTGLELFDATRVSLWQAKTWLSALNKIGSSRAELEKESFETLKDEQGNLKTLERTEPVTPRDRWLLKLQKTRVQAALLHHGVRADTESWKADVELQEQRIKLARLTLSSLTPRIVFPASLLQQKREALKASENLDEKASTQIESQIRKFPSTNPAKNNRALSAFLLQGLENQLQVIEYKRVGMMMLLQIWQMRHDLWNSSDAETLEKTGRSISSRMQDIQTWQPLITGLRAKLQDRRREALNLVGSDTPANIREFVDKALRQEEDTLANWENSFDELSQLCTLANADFTDRRKSSGLGKNFDSAASTLAGQMKAVWNTEIFQLTDSVVVNGQMVQRPSPITLGMLLSALVILGAGGLISAAFSRWLRLRLTKRFRLEANTGAIVQKFSHYFLLVCVSLIALAVVKIPLTIFALLGGAAAIAVGFGTQQLVSNLISGIILLFERPIRIGDQVDVGSFIGTVTAIGTRCSQLRRADGVEILIPNSTILQSTVVNWTLSDTHARQELVVGISYGSVAEDAINIIRNIAKAHPKILKTYESDVFFHDFGNDGIALRLLYWIDRSQPGVVNQVPSELRLSIYNALNAAGIKLASAKQEVTK